MDQYGKLKDYVKKSELRIYKDTIYIKLSKELSEKYDNGIYNNYFNKLLNCYLELKDLDIKYPASSKPILYIYIVPDDNYQELLQIPKKFDRGFGGGKPVTCFELDGFKSAYGISQGICERYSENINISRKVNNIHELFHLIHGEFQRNESFISEGLAEAVPLHIMGYEEHFLEHRDIVLNLKDDQIISSKELINSERDNSFGKEESLPNKSCSFRYSYISSYLFIRVILEQIERKESLSKKEALIFLLKLLRETPYSGEWLVEYLAFNTGLNKEDLLNNINLQKEIINSITKK